MGDVATEREAHAGQHRLQLVSTHTKQRPNHLDVPELARIPQRRPPAAVGAVDQLDDIFVRATVLPRQVDVAPEQVVDHVHVPLDHCVLHAAAFCA